MIKREQLYLGIKNDEGMVTPLVGMYEENKIRNLENGELLDTSGEVYGAIEGFPACPLDHILKAWKFEEQLTEEEITMITTIFQNPSFVHREMERIGDVVIDEGDLWMMKHIYILMENTKEEKRKHRIDKLEEEKEQLYTLRQRILEHFLKGKQKKIG